VRTRTLGRAIVALALAAAGAGARASAPPAHPAAAAAPPAKKPEQLIQAEKPPFSEGVFPCTSCHRDLPKNKERRELGYHDEVVLNHGPPENRWCLDCHDLNDRDVLHLTNGDPVPFTESYRLCGQCHGDKYRDWKVGVHGKRVGQWDGQKTYYLCVNCHNPHSPRFRPLKPEPPPVRPEDQRS
jgi:hypothetical protein